MYYFLRNNFRLLLAKACRPLYCVLYGRREDNWICTRYIFRYICGCLFAWLLWKIMLMNFIFSMDTRFIVLAAIIVIIGFGFVFSVGIRCVTLLIFVAIVGKSGRSYLRALSFAYVIAGPIENLSENGEEVVRVFACATTLTYNLTKTRFDLMTKPFQNTLSTMKDDIRDVKNSFADMRGVLEPIHAEVESDGIDTNKTKAAARGKRTDADNATKAKQIQSKYKKKFEKRCRKQLDKAKARCEEAFAKAYEKCKAKFPIIVESLLCWPFKVDFICAMNILGDPDKICDPSEAIPDSFGDSYVKLDVMENDLVKNSANVQVKYKIQKIKTPPNLKNAAETADNVMKEVKSTRRIFDSIMNVFTSFLSLLFLRLIFSSIHYHRKYRKQIDFDNMYISEYFRHVDERRKNTGKRSLLPFKKYEKKNLVDASRPCSRNKQEFNEVVFNMIQFSLEVMTACFFILLDYLIVNLLDIIRMKSLITYVQEGEHTIHFQINGTGLMARLLRKTLRNFNMHEHITTYLTNEPCLPRPSMLPISFYVKLMLLYFVVVILIYKSTMFIRLRRLICGYFYRKREKKRILYLYNSLLQQRRTLFEMMLRNAEANIAKHTVRRKLNLLLKLRVTCPMYFDWLKCFKVARRKCLICDDLEDDGFIICSTPKCGFAYCKDCFEDIDIFCLYCKQRIKRIRVKNLNTLFENVT